MKQLFVYSIICIYLLSISRNGMVFIWFKINQKQIAQTECVEKDAEVNTCCGQCVLNKKVSETSQKDAKGAIPVSIDERPFNVFYHYTDHSIAPANFSKPIFYVYTLISIKYEYLSSIFQPPELYDFV